MRPCTTGGPSELGSSCGVGGVVVTNPGDLDVPRQTRPVALLETDQAVGREPPGLARLVRADWVSVGG